MLQRAFEAAGLMWRELHTEDRGDGTLIVVPPDTPASAVAARALGQLAAALRRHNQSARRRNSARPRAAVNTTTGTHSRPYWPNPKYGGPTLATRRACGCLRIRDLLRADATSGGGDDAPHPDWTDRATPVRGEG